MPKEVVPSKLNVKPANALLMSVPLTKSSASAVIVTACADPVSRKKTTVLNNVLIPVPQILYFVWKPT
jgi:hypothetical protein